MASYRTTFDLASPVADVFAFFSRPVNLLTLAPPELPMQLVDGPDVLAPGARVTWQLKRWGICSTVTHEVTGWTENALIVQEQRQGPFVRWRQQFSFAAIPAGTRLAEDIDFEPPRGMLGRLVTEATVRTELDTLVAYRTLQLTQRSGLVQPAR